MVSATNVKGLITYANQKFSDIIGYSKEELVGLNHRLLSSDNQPKDYWHEMYLTCSKGNKWNGNICNKNKEGNYYWVDTIITAIFDGDKISGYMSISTETPKSRKLSNYSSKLALTIKAEEKKTSR